MELRKQLLTMCDGTPVTEWNRTARWHELLDTLREHVYGYVPLPPETKDWAKVEDNPFALGHVRRYTLCHRFPKGAWDITFTALDPKTEELHPCIVYLADSDVPDGLPTEQILHSGCSLVIVNCNQIAPDNDDPKGLADCFEVLDKDRHWGRISVWAWGLMRVMDVLWDIPTYDNAYYAVAGAGPLGTAALWCAAQDTRFSYVLAHNTGKGGAALFTEDELRGYGADPRLPKHLFCRNFRKEPELAPPKGGVGIYGIGEDTSEKLHYNQHFLVGAVAPRCALINCVGTDVGEQACCSAASCAWEVHGRVGYGGPQSGSVAGASFTEGNLGYRLRGGDIALDASDWQAFLDFIRTHKGRV